MSAVGYEIRDQKEPVAGASESDVLEEQRSRMSYRDGVMDLSSASPHCQRACGGRRGSGGRAEKEKPSSLNIHERMLAFTSECCSNTLFRRRKYINE